MKKNSIVIFCILSFLSLLNAKEFSNSEIQKIVDDFYYENNRSLHIWKEGRSSVLLEANKVSDFYEWKNLVDQDETTAWVEGVNGSGIGEYVCLDVLCLDEYDTLVGFNHEDGEVKIHLNINNGYCKNEVLHKKNNRVKEACVRIYDIPISVDMNNTYVKGNPQKIYDEKIYLNDILTKQSFLFNVTIPQNEDCYSTMLLLEFEILDVYKGTDFDDTAISEIEVFGEYLNTQD